MVFLENGLEKIRDIFRSVSVLKIFSGEMLKVAGLDRGKGIKRMRQKAGEMGKHRWECSEVLKSSCEQSGSVWKMKATCLK